MLATRPLDLLTLTIKLSSRSKKEGLQSVAAFRQWPDSRLLEAVESLNDTWNDDDNDDNNDDDDNDNVVGSGNITNRFIYASRWRGDRFIFPVNKKGTKFQTNSAPK